MIASEIRTAEAGGMAFRNAENLMDQLNTEGKIMAIEYMEYLVSTGKYQEENCKEK